MSQNLEICDGCKVSSTNLDVYLRSVLEKAINSGSCHCKQWRIQDFPEEGTLTPKGGAPTYYLANFFRKLHENEEILGHGGGARPSRPPRSATGKCLFGHEKSGINVQPPALIVASILNHTECVKTLIEAGADVNVTTANKQFLSQRTALSLAALMGHSEFVNTLIAAGADVNKMDEKNFTALTFAAQGGQSE